MAVLFDITVKTIGYGSVELFAVSLNSVGQRAQAMADMLDENAEAVEAEAQTPRPVVPGSIEDAESAVAVTYPGLRFREAVPPKRVTPPAKAIYTNAQFDQMCGERNIETGERCASLKKHRGVHAWRMITDGAQPEPTGAST